MHWSSKTVTDDLDKRDLDQRAAVAADPGAARVVTTRRRLMLGAAAVLPSVVTLRSGAQGAAQSFDCLPSGKKPGAMLNNMGAPRFTDVPDEWLRKQVFSGQAVLAGRIAYCTTWDQPTVLAIATFEKTASGMAYKALLGTTWSTGNDPEDSFKISAPCPPWESGKGAGMGSYCYSESVENISSAPDHYALVYVDDTGLSCSLEPGPGLSPVRATCWASLAASRGTSLG